MIKLRMKPRLKLLVLSTIILLTLCQSSFIQCSTPDEVRDKLAEAFEAVLEAEKAGGAVSRQVDELNHAIKLLEEGDLEEAESLVGNVLAAVPEIKQAGLILTRNQQLMAVGMLTLLSVLGVVVWRFGRRIFWILWLRSKKGWKILDG